MSDLFFQSLDQARMQACVKGIAREGMCVVVHCPQAALLNYYGHIFLNHLHEVMPSGTVESYSPSDSDVLIDNFNQLVSEMSVQEALKPGNLSEVSKVWVIKNAQDMASHELELLGQLLQQFPGSKVRFILWMAVTEPSASLLNALGAKMMRWHIALPTSAETQSFWSEARAAGKEEDVRPMLEELKLLDYVPANLRAVKASKSSGAVNRKNKKSRLTVLQVALWSLLLMALLMGSTAMVAWLQPDAFAWLKNQNSDPVVLEAETKIDAPTQEPAPPPQPPQTTEASTPKLPEESKTLATNVEETLLELPDEALAGKKWAEQLPSPRWLVLHGAYKSLAVANQVKKAYPGLKNSRVVPVYKPNEPLASFVLASGPFEALQIAEEFTKLSTLPNPGTVRTDRNLKNRLNPVQELRTKP